MAAGLSQIPDDDGLVLVHDAARPLASAVLVRRVLSKLSAGIDGVVPALPVRDTLRRSVEGRVTETVDRSNLFAVQTPQGFPVATLRAAHAATDEDATDDAVLVERLGGDVVVVEGEPGNVKITFPEDLQLAEALLG